MVSHTFFSGQHILFEDSHHLESLITITELYRECEHIANEIKNRILEFKASNYTLTTCIQMMFAGGTNQVKSLEYIIFAFTQGYKECNSCQYRKHCLALHLAFIFPFLFPNFIRGSGPCPTAGW